MGQLIDLSNGLEIEIDLWDDIEILDYQIWLKSKSGLKYFHDKVLVNDQSHTIAYSFNFTNVDNNEIIVKLRVRDIEKNKVEKEVRIMFED